jgi:hypothetical protein
MRGNRTLSLIFGIVMLGLGAYVALRPLWSHGATVTRQRWLDIAFAGFFLLRGGMKVNAARRTHESEESTP